jgi:hypothetical protein
MSNFKKTIIVISMLLSGCTPTLLFENIIPDLSKQSDKGLVVYMRTVDVPDFSYTSMSGVNGLPRTVVSVDPEGTESKIYVDGKYTSGTKSGCLTTFELDDGPHIISACDDMCGRIKINAIKGKIYFIEEMPFPMGPLGTKFNIQYLSKEDAEQKLKVIQYKYSKPNPKNREDDMDSDDAADELEEWNDWAKENPEKARIEEEYQGY